MLFVVAYDIPDDGTRTQIADELGNWGYRVQYSVFECDLDQTRYRQMVTRLRKLVCARDSIRIYRACQACAGEIILLGRSKPVTRDADYYQV
jgi:CRISPR-associated protein Cas2